MTDNKKWPALAARKITRRVVVRGELALLSPAHLGSGESSDVSDMPLLTAPDDGETPLLTGASLAGALRSYLRRCELGGFRPEQGEEKDTLAVCLFGGNRADDDGKQSPLIVEDAYGRSPGIEQRAGVSLDLATRTAADNLLYDAQYWQAGTTFSLRFELLMCEGDPAEKMLRALAAALRGLERGEIALGARKQRGFGQCAVANWQVDSYDLSQVADLLAWLQDQPAAHAVGTQIAPLLGVDERTLPDRRCAFTVEATFALVGSLKIGSSVGDPGGPDSVHLHSQRGGKPRPVLSGTSLGGALRARAYKIANTIGLRPGFVDELFGPKLVKGQETSPRASRLRVTESVIEGTPGEVGDELVQNRVKIDRFTGGAFPTALFAEQPVFASAGGSRQTRVSVRLALQEPSEAQIGLLLLLLKDLWTEDLPLGGGSGVGRGRLRGLDARLVYRQPGQPEQAWVFEKGQGETLAFKQGQPGDLQTFVDQLWQEVNQ